MGDAVLEDFRGKDRAKVLYRILTSRFYTIKGETGDDEQLISVVFVICVYDICFCIYFLGQKL